jgi:hypothetical protein
MGQHKGAQKSIPEYLRKFVFGISSLTVNGAAQRSKEIRS